MPRGTEHEPRIAHRRRDEYRIPYDKDELDEIEERVRGWLGTKTDIKLELIRGCRLALEQRNRIQAALVTLRECNTIMNEMADRLDDADLGKKSLIYGILLSDKMIQELSVYT